jgi:hypothetical protein
MWMYLGPSCRDRHFSVELDGTEMNIPDPGGSLLIGPIKILVPAWSL